MAAMPATIVLKMFLRINLVLFCFEFYFVTAVTIYHRNKISYDFVIKQYGNREFYIIFLKEIYLILYLSEKCCNFEENKTDDIWNR